MTDSKAAKITAAQELEVQPATPPVSVVGAAPIGQVGSQRVVEAQKVTMQESAGDSMATIRSKKGSTKLVLGYALVAGVIALVTGPIPGTSIALTVLEVVMVYQIAKRYGFQLDLHEIGLVGTTIFGGSAAFKLLISTLMEFIPILGWFIVKPGIAFIFVIGLGFLADMFFKDRRRPASIPLLTPPDQEGIPAPQVQQSVYNMDDQMELGETSGFLCSTCGQQLSPGMRFCPQDGTPIAPKCAKCGQANAPNSKFCSGCGKKLQG